MRLFIVAIILFSLPCVALSATNQYSYDVNYPWQGTITTATYTSDVLQVYSSVNLMYDLVAINNNLYTIYGVLYNYAGAARGFSQSTYFMLRDEIKPQFSNISTSLAQVRADSAETRQLIGNATFGNYSAKLASIEGRIVNMDPCIITQSMSFFAGVLCSVSFVLAVKFMGGNH